MAAPAPAYIAHQGTVTIEIDHAFRPEVIGFNRRKTTPTSVKKMAGGASKTRGIPDYSGSFTLMIPATGYAGLLDLDDFTISYPWGGKKYLLQHCSWNEDDRTSTPGAGDSSQTLNFTGISEVDI